MSRPVPPHGSGPAQIYPRGDQTHVLRRADPDETAGRALYRAIAEAEARRSMASSRRVRLCSEPADGPLSGQDGIVQQPREEP